MLILFQVKTVKWDIQKIYCDFHFIVSSWGNKIAEPLNRTPDNGLNDALSITNQGDTMSNNYKEK